MQLDQLFKVFQDDFHIGAAVNLRTIASGAALLETQFNSITAENDMKPELLHPSEDVYTFDAADRLAEFAKENGLSMRGHTLVWHNQTPDWFFEEADGSPVGREKLLSRMKSHIDTVVGRYKDTIYCWDVVNEAVEDTGEQLYRNTKWLELLGESYIADAFRFAHAADPNAQLFYNDYNECDTPKREKIYTLVKSLLEQGTPIHGIGMQGHWGPNHPALDLIREAIERYASLGLPIHITELDVSVFSWDDHRTDLQAPLPEMMEKQAARYADLFRLFKEYRSAISSVTFWGVADDYTWLHDFPASGRRNWPFLFNEQHQPKKAFHEVIQAAKAGALK